MKFIVISILVLLCVVSAKVMRNAVTEPSSGNKYRTSDVFSREMNNDGTFSFYPFLNEFVSYYGWYRKADSQKSESENLKEQIKAFKVKLFKDPSISTKELVEKKMVHNEAWLKKQIKIARILELEDLLQKK